MTGFGRGVAGEGPSRVEATVQGWNHRHADLVFRLPEVLRPEERSLRQLVLASVDRGRCEITIRLSPGAGAATVRRLDVAAARQFLADAEPLLSSGAVTLEWTLGDLARAPFFEAPEIGETAASGLLEPTRAALSVALKAFDDSRREEGLRLEAILITGLDDLSAVVGRIRELRAGAVASFEAALRDRLEQMLPGGAEALPADRLAQEVVLLADRADVREEMDRLEGHLIAARENLSRPGPHGRRMDFLVQEILRELNTVGSKSRDLEISQLVVEAKVINERIREQVQNVE